MNDTCLFKLSTELRSFVSNLIFSIKGPADTSSGIQEGPYRKIKILVLYATFYSVLGVVTTRTYSSTTCLCICYLTVHQCTKPVFLLYPFCYSLGSDTIISHQSLRYPVPRDINKGLTGLQSWTSGTVGQLLI